MSKKIEFTNEERLIISSEIREFKETLNSNDIKTKEDLLNLNIKLIDGDGITPSDLHMLSKLVFKYEQRIRPLDLNELSILQIKELEMKYNMTRTLKAKIYNEMNISKELMEIALIQPRTHIR